MKRKFVFVLMVVLLCSMPIYLTGQPTFPVNTNIAVRVESMVVDKGQMTTNLVKGYLLQSLRQIPDVVIVDNASVTIHIVAAETSGFYTIAYAVTSRSESAIIELFVVPEGKNTVNQLLKGTSRFLMLGFSNASLQTLEQQCKSIIVGIDSQFFQEMRNANQQLIREFQKNGNP